MSVVDLNSPRAPHPTINNHPSRGGGHNCSRVEPFFSINKHSKVSTGQTCLCLHRARSRTVWGLQSGAVPLESCPRSKTYAFSTPVERQFQFVKSQTTFEWQDRKFNCKRATPQISASSTFAGTALAYQLRAPRNKAPIKKDLRPRCRQRRRPRRFKNV